MRAGIRVISVRTICHRSTRYIVSRYIHLQEEDGHARSQVRSFIDGRRDFIRTGLGVAGGLALPAGFASRALAADQPPIGTWPAGVARATRSSSASPCRAPAPTRCRARTSSRASSSPIEHINAGHPLIKQISPKTTKGVLGKEVKYGVADSAAKPNDAVQAQQRFITENKAILITGSHLERGRGGAEQARAAREGAVRGRHLRLERHHRQGLRALRLPPELLRRDRGQRDRPGAGQGFRQEQEGRVHDARLHLRPHRHEVGERLPDQERRLDDGDQPGLAARRARLFSSYLPNIANSGADVLDQRQLGPRRGAVDPAGQAVRHARQDEAGDPLPDPVPRARGRRRT